MDKHEIINKSKDARSRLDEIIDILIERGDLLANVSKNWRVKDILVHIYWHEKEMLNLVKTMNLEGSPYWLLPTDERNEQIFQEFYDLEVEEIISEYKQAFPSMIDQILQLPEEATEDPSYFQNMPHDWQPWKVFAGNMFKHYEDHIIQLKKRFKYLK
jgi:hypothetical protein